jgi:DNA-binding transcriptional regulator YdaS (Cro superfamily)
MNPIFRSFLLAAILVFPGCVCDAAKDQAKRSSKASDTYASLIESTFEGTIKKEDGTPVTATELAATPASVKALLQNVITAVYLSRKGWHQIEFAIAGGIDPETLDLAVPSFFGE